MESAAEKSITDQLMEQKSKDVHYLRSFKTKQCNSDPHKSETSILHSKVTGWLKIL